MVLDRGNKREVDGDRKDKKIIFALALRQIPRVNEEASRSYRSPQIRTAQCQIRVVSRQGSKQIKTTENLIHAKINIGTVIIIFKSNQSHQGKGRGANEREEQGNRYSEVLPHIPRESVSGPKEINRRQRRFHKKILGGAIRGGC